MSCRYARKVHKLFAHMDDSGDGAINFEAKGFRIVDPATMRARSNNIKLHAQMLSANTSRGPITQAFGVINPKEARSSHRVAVRSKGLDRGYIGGYIRIMETKLETTM